MSVVNDDNDKDSKTELNHATEEVYLRPLSSTFSSIITLSSNCTTRQNIISYVYSKQLTKPLITILINILIVDITSEIAILYKKTNPDRL